MADTAPAGTPAGVTPTTTTATSSSPPSPPPEPQEEQQSTTPSSSPPPPAAAAAAAAPAPAAAGAPAPVAFDPELLEVKDLVQKALERQGLLNHVRALLRAAVSVAIDNSTEDLALLHPNQRVREFAALEEGQLALGLVRELLEGLGLRHTLAVFLPEANLLKPSQQQQQQQEETQGKETRRAELRAALGMGPSAAEETPVLVEIIQAARARGGEGVISSSTSSLGKMTTDTAMFKTAFLEQQEKEEEEEAEGQQQEEEEGETSGHARMLEAVALQAGGATWGGEGGDVDDTLAATAGEPSGSEAAQEEEAALERSTEPETGADD